MTDKEQLQEIKERLVEIKKKSKEITIILPSKPGKDMIKNFNKINKILDKLLKQLSKPA